MRVCPGCPWWSLPSTQRCATAYTVTFWPSALLLCSTVLSCTLMYAPVLSCTLLCFCMLLWLSLLLCFTCSFRFDELLLPLSSGANIRHARSWHKEMISSLTSFFAFHVQTPPCGCWRRWRWRKDVPVCASKDAEADLCLGSSGMRRVALRTPGGWACWLSTASCFPPWEGLGPQDGRGTGQQVCGEFVMSLW